MAIIAENKGQKFEPIPAGNYVARCYSMIQIGTVKENVMGKEKELHKVRLTFELPTELKVFKEENGEQPCVISQEYTLSMHEKATLRKVLESWRGKAFSEEEAKAFDITVLLGKACMLNVIHKESNGSTYANIGSISAMPKGLTCPPQINETQCLSYDNFDHMLFASLPQFIKDKIVSSVEYRKLVDPNHVEASALQEEEDNLPF